MRINLLFPGRAPDYLASQPMFQRPVFWSHDSSASGQGVFEPLTVNVVE